MSAVANPGSGTTWRILVIAAGLLALTAGAASAQMTFDGNIVWDNNLLGGNTLANQYVGAPSASPDSNNCPAGYNAFQLATVTFTHNKWANPMLPAGVVYTPNVIPNFQPLLGSPAYGLAMTVPDPWFVQTCYAGAIGPNPEDNWVKTSTWGNNPSAGDLAVPNKGWCYYDTTGAHRHDLHLASNGDPDPRPLAIYDHINLYVSQTWAADSNYLVRGFLRIKDQATLTIPAGVVILEDQATLGTIVADRGGRVVAIGTEDKPIIITSGDAPGSQATGAGGGIYLLGRAKTNLVDVCAGDSAGAEGGDVGFYGGSDDHDDSGTLEYVRVEFAGKEITPNNELNSFTFCGCGDNTTLDHLEAFDGVDDAFEFFGGTANIRYAVGIDGRDDGYDVQLGYRGKGQFIIDRPWAGKSPAGDQNGDKGLEWDNNEFEYTATRCAGVTNVMCVNCTFVGDHRQGPLWPGPSSAVNMRNGRSQMLCENSICYDFKLAALKIDTNDIWRPHCDNIPVEPAVYCAGLATGVAPIQTGNLFVVNGSPNPFRSRLDVSFALPQAGHVTVEVFAADGRRVGVLADEDMAAGQHTVTWNVGRSMPSGMYFYKVRAGETQSTGKVTRVD
jgi:hypothetical protein